ncbi:MAG: hypothetical protein ACP5KK_02515 [Candidatus Nanoarchaeia archaeon]
MAKKLSWSKLSWHAKLAIGIIAILIMAIVISGVPQVAEFIKAKQVKQKPKAPQTQEIQETQQAKAKQKPQAPQTEQEIQESQQAKQKPLEIQPSPIPSTAIPPEQMLVRTGCTDTDGGINSTVRGQCFEIWTDANGSRYSTLVGTDTCLSNISNKAVLEWYCGYASNQTNQTNQTPKCLATEISCPYKFTCAGGACYKSTIIEPV